jgi:hypothetical protein
LECPNCKLVNPPGGARCDCGYDFETHTIEGGRQVAAALPIWRDAGLHRAVRFAMWGTLLACPLGVLVNGLAFGAEGGVAWVLAYGEKLYMLEWVWLGPAAVALVSFGRLRAALGVLVAGVGLGATHFVASYLVVQSGLR